MEKVKYTIPKELKKNYDEKHITMTNEEKLQKLEDILYRRLEGEFDYELLKKRLELLLLIAKIKRENR